MIGNRSITKPWLKEAPRFHAQCGGHLNWFDSRKASVCTRCMAYVLWREDTTEYPDFPKMQRLKRNLRRRTRARLAAAKLPIEYPKSHMRTKNKLK